MIGKKVSHYEIIEKLGEGGMGVVFKANDTRLNRTVALKFLPLDLTRDPEVRKRFVQEAQAASALDHQNICTIYDIKETDDGQLFIVMACYEGETLKDRIEREPLTIEEATEIATQIARGLSKAHAIGIIHRDIKPANVLITEDNEVKIIDFGLARLSGQARLTKSHITMGTVAYMSPEQTRGDQVDHRTDIWSLGVVLYEMLTKELPFKGDYEQAVMYSILHEEPALTSSIREDLPQLIERTVSKSLEKEPAMRCQSMEDFFQELQKSEVVTIQGKQEKSIAVLPFENMSADPDQEYFCEGMAEEIINALTHIENLRVVARTSAFSFKGKDIDIREIGQKLNVNSILEGSVRKSGNRLRITAQLISVGDGYHLWSERYDRKMSDIFDIQDEISLAIVDKLKVKLLGEEKAFIVRRYTENLEAYNLYLEGRFFYLMFSAEAFEKAIECFEQALRKDPDYALAYAGMADVLFFKSFFGVAPKVTMPKAKEFLEKALAIDENLAEAHAILGRIISGYDWNWTVAEQEFERALLLNPNSSMIHLHYSGFLSWTGRHDEAIAAIKRARELDPLSIFINAIVGERLYFAGQHDKAIQSLEKTITKDPNYFYSYWLLGLAYLGKSKVKRAVAELEKALDLSGGASIVVWTLVTTYYMLGKKQEAEELFSRLDAMAKDEYVPPSFFFCIHRTSGDMDLASRWLERAFEDRDLYLPFHVIWPEDLFRIPYDQRSSELIKQMKSSKR